MIVPLPPENARGVGRSQFPVPVTIVKGKRMTEEKTLSQAVNDLAERNARKLMERIYQELSNCLKNYYRPKEANDEFIRDDIFAILKQYITNADSQTRICPPPSNILINGCRAKIIEDLLNGLPKIQELLRLQQQLESEQE